MANINPELIEKAKTAETAEVLLAMAKEAGVALTAQEAAEYFKQIHPALGELDDDDLDNVAGGCGGSSEPVTNLDPIPPRITYLHYRNGCPHCGIRNAFVSNSDENNWAVVCLEKCPEVRGSGRKSFWDTVELA